MLGKLAKNNQKMMPTEVEELPFLFFKYFRNTSNDKVFETYAI